MIGTSAAFITTNLVAPFLAGDPRKAAQPASIALAAGIVGLSMVVISLVVGWFLPEPKAEGPE
jgi:hypothetical protein